jgi:outer membrane immunogenic protein
MRFIRARRINTMLEAAMATTRQYGAALGLVAAIGLQGAAGAADLRLPTKSRAIAPAAPTWTGCYIGGHGGLGVGRTTWSDPVSAGIIDSSLSGQSVNTDMSGGLLGAQAGCDYQINGQFVVGVQGATSWTTISATNGDPSNRAFSLHSNLDWLTDVSGRAGFAFNTALIYGRIGYAWAGNSFEISGATSDGTPSVTRTGWVYGGGAEWLFARNWSVFLEGNIYNFNSTNVAFKGDVVVPTAPFAVNSSLNVETLKLGLNFRFGSDLLGARF